MTEVQWFVINSLFTLISSFSIGYFFYRLQTRTTAETERRKQTRLIRRGKLYNRIALLLKPLFKVSKGWLSVISFLGVITFLTTLYQTNGNLIVTVAGIGVLVGVLASVFEQSGRKVMAIGVTMIGVIVVLYIDLTSVLHIARMLS